MGIVQPWGEQAISGSKSSNCTAARHSERSRARCGWHRRTIADAGALQIEAVKLAVESQVLAPDARQIIAFALPG